MTFSKYSLGRGDPFLSREGRAQSPNSLKRMLLRPCARFRVNVVVVQSSFVLLHLQIGCNVLILKDLWFDIANGSLLSVTYDTLCSNVHSVCFPQAEKAKKFLECRTVTDSTDHPEQRCKTARSFPADWIPGIFDKRATWRQHNGK